jgi:hypothetical protein
VFLQVRHVQHRAGFEQQDGNAQIGKHLRRRTPACARADDHDIVDGLAACDLRHVGLHS